MKNNNLWLLFLGLAICGGTILVNRFVTLLPDWLSIVLLLVGAACLCLFIYQRLNGKQNSGT